MWAVTREEQLDAVSKIMGLEHFAVFAFAGETGEPPYSVVMFFAEREGLEVIFGTVPGPSKGPYARDGNGVSVQIDTRGVGVENMAKFSRVSLRGYLRLLEEPDEIARAQSVYSRKLPFAKVFLDRPEVRMFVVQPLRVVCARGLGERFEIEFPDPRPSG